MQRFRCWMSILCVVLLAVGLVSCSKNEVVISGGGLNVPAFTSSLNVFNYAIDARRLSNTQIIPLVFTRNRLQTSAVISNLTQGQAIFTILDQASRVIHTDTFRLVGMYWALMLTGSPSSIAITLQDFTGSMEYSLIGDTTVAVFSVNDFPNRRGSQWTYFVYDSLARQADTLVVTVCSQSILPGNIPATVWQHAYRSRTDTQYVEVAGDTVRFRPSQNTPWYETKYVFPLYIGKAWRGDIEYDTSMVIQVGPVTTRGEAFLNGFLIQEQWSGLNFGSVQTWLVPRIGIVKLHRRAGNFIVRNVTWDLISYRLQ